MALNGQFFADVPLRNYSLTFVLLRGRYRTREQEIDMFQGQWLCIMPSWEQPHDSFHLLDEAAISESLT